MITRRDIVVALAAAGATLCAVAVASERATAPPSWIIDWNAIPAKPTAAGSSRSFFRAPTATLTELEVHVTTLNPGQSPHPPHRHPNEEMVIVKEGMLESLIDGEWKRVGPGSVIFNASNQLHGLRNPGPAPATYHVISWTTAATPAAAERPGKP
jgi:XRE family transcriptional regulator, regulator of sulfur utilization